jgi:hypothetical protein
LSLNQDDINNQDMDQYNLFFLLIAVQYPGSL